MPKTEWSGWIRCNILEIIILILVLILVINTFSKEPVKLEEKTEPITEEQAQPKQISEGIEKPSEQATPTEQIKQEQIPQP